MPYYWAIFDYTCANGHRNHLDKFYKAEDMEHVQKKFPQLLPCWSCPPGTISVDRPMGVEFRVHEMTESQFRELGKPLEPDTDPS